MKDEGFVERLRYVSVALCALGYILDQGKQHLKTFCCTIVTERLRLPT